MNCEDGRMLLGQQGPFAGAGDGPRLMFLSNSPPGEVVPREKSDGRETCQRGDTI